MKTAIHRHKNNSMELIPNSIDQHNILVPPHIPAWVNEIVNISPVGIKEVEEFI
jgi:hypothetical protein